MHSQTLVPSKPPDLHHPFLQAVVWGLTLYAVAATYSWLSASEGTDYAFLRLLLPAVVVGGAVTLLRRRSGRPGYLGALTMIAVTATSAIALSGQDRLVLEELRGYEQEATSRFAALVEQSLERPTSIPSGPDRESRLRAVQERIANLDALAERHAQVQFHFGVEQSLHARLRKKGYSIGNASARLQELHDSAPFREMSEVLNALAAEMTAERFWVRLLERADGQWTVRPTGEIEFFDSVSEKEVELFRTLDAELTEARAEFRRVASR